MTPQTNQQTGRKSSEQADQNELNDIGTQKPIDGTQKPIDAADLPSFLYYHLYRAQNRIAQDFSDAVGPDEVTPCQFNALCHIRTHPGLSQTQLSGAIGREKSTVTPIIDRLERRGLVSREASPSDRRTYALYLSDLGETTYRRMVETAADHDQNMQERLSPTDLATLVDLLQRVCAE